MKRCVLNLADFLKLGHEQYSLNETVRWSIKLTFQALCFSQLRVRVGPSSPKRSFTKRQETRKPNTHLVPQLPEPPPLSRLDDLVPRLPESCMISQHLHYSEPWCNHLWGSQMSPDQFFWKIAHNPYNIQQTKLLYHICHLITLNEKWSQGIQLKMIACRS